MKNTVEKILRMRFAIPLLIAAVLLLALISEVTYQKTKLNLTNGINLTDARIGASKLFQLLTDAETGQRGYLLTENLAYLEPWHNAQYAFKQSDSFFKNIDMLVPNEVKETEKIRTIVLAKFAEMNTIVAIAQNGDRDRAMALVQSGNGKRLMDELRGLMKSKLDKATDLQQEARNSIYASLEFNRVAVLILSCVLALGLYIYTHQVQALARERANYQQTLEKEVAEKSAGIKTLAAWLETAREEEKSHLARELHDELGGILTAAKLTTARIRAKMGDDPKVTELIDAVNLRLNEGIAIKRRIIEDLRPSTLSMLGLHVALENLCAQAQQQLGVPVTADIAEIQIHRDAELAIFRVVQEALTNIAKYSKATQVTVQLAQTNENILLKITDNGVGFDPATHTAGQHGLAGMQFRMGSHGGTLSVTSTPQQGVTIVASLPRQLNVQTT
jgi:signal transduction histidine kinase